MSWRGQGTTPGQVLRWDGTKHAWYEQTSTLEVFGAKGNGVDDDSAALTAALAWAAAGGGLIELGAQRTYKVVGPFSWPAGVIRGQESTLYTVANAAILVIAGQNCMLQDVRLLGNGVGASQIGVQNGSAGASTGFSEFRADGVRCDSLGGYGMLLQQTLDTLGAGEKRGPRISRFEAAGCGTGLAVGPRAEYVVLSEPAIRACGTGLLVQGGNFTGIGGYCNECSVSGVELGVGTNDSHGIITGMEINHTAAANVAVRAGAIGAGFTFSNCQVYYGDIRLVGSRGVKFIGGQIDVDNYYFDGSFGTEFDGVALPSGLANTVNNDVGGHASETLWRPNCRLLTGVAPAYDQWVGGHTRVTLSGNIAKTAAQFNAEFTLISDTLAVKAMSRHTGFTYATFYDTGTGVWTVRGFGDGTFYMRGQIRLVVNAAETGIFYLYIKRNGAKVSPYYVGVHLTATIVAFFLDTRIPCDPGDTFEITIGGSATLNDGLVASSEHFIETEGH